MAEETKIMFDATLKAKWIAALRSGEFNQARSRLRDHDNYCCLGVLACVLGASWKDKSIPVIRGKPLATNSVYVLESMCGLALGAQYELAELNDTGVTFPEIADYIEQNIPTITDGLITSSEPQSNEEVVVSNNLSSPLSHK
jgi:hypothetical protein